MALKPAKATTPPESVAQSAAPDIDIESMIAEEILNDIDWQKVRAALFRKASARLFTWLTSGSDRPINISAYPELSALPSSEDRAA
jgi:hypothetical protein